MSYLDLYTMGNVRVDDVAQLAGTYWVSEVPDLAGYRFRRRRRGHRAGERLHALTQERSATLFVAAFGGPHEAEFFDLGSRTSDRS